MFVKWLSLALLIQSILATPLQPKTHQIRPRIIYGENAKWHSFPYMVSIRERIKFDDQEYFVHFCGGALITARLVLSAQHCFIGDSSKHLGYYADLRLTVGAMYTHGDGDSYEVGGVIVQLDYDPKENQNDLVFITTDTPVVFSKRVQPIAISKKWIEPGQVAKFCGFGFTVTGNFKENEILNDRIKCIFLIGANYNSPLYLQSTNFRVISNDECVKLNRPDRQTWVQNITLCTFNYDDTSAIYGDSGGPLVIDNKLVGIASWGTNEFGFPTAFMRLSEYTQWIEEKIKLYDY